MKIQIKVATTRRGLLQTVELVAEVENELERDTFIEQARRSDFADTGLIFPTLREGL